QALTSPYSVGPTRFASLHSGRRGLAGPLLALRRAERRGAILEQRDRCAGAGLVAQAHREALAIGGAHAGDAFWRPVGLADHVPDDGNLLDHRLVHAVLLPRVTVAARAQKPLGEIGSAATRATPDRHAGFHSGRPPSPIRHARASTRASSKKHEPIGTMDCRVKPGNDAEDRRTVMRRAPARRPPRCRRSDTWSCRSRSPPPAARR